MSSSEASSSGSESEAPDRPLPQRGSKRKGAFEPPRGAVLIGGPDGDGGAIETGEFEWDSIKDDKNIELWLVRVPNSIKPKNLDNAVFNAPSSSSTHTLGQVKYKREMYDLWSLGGRDDKDSDHDQIGGDEMRGLSYLLPRKSTDGNLHLGPKPIARRLILAASPPTPNTQNPAVLHQNPPRHSYPIERFKHRYTPYGTTVTPAPPTASPASHKGSQPEPDPSPPSSPRVRKRPKPTDGQKKTTKKSKAGRP